MPGAGEPAVAQPSQVARRTDSLPSGLRCLEAFGAVRQDRDALAISAVQALVTSCEVMHFPADPWMREPRSAPMISLLHMLCWMLKFKLAKGVISNSTLRTAEHEDLSQNGYGMHMHDLSLTIMKLSDSQMKH